MRGNRVKQAIDIEDLLVWAYRDMQAEQLWDDDTSSRLGIASGWGAIASVGAYGAVVQSSSYIPEPGDRDDAALVHRAVLGLDDAFLVKGEGGLSVYDRGLLAEAGCTLVERSGERPLMVQPDGEAVLVERVVISVYLVLHARVASRPDCYADVARRRGRPTKNGEVAEGLTYDEMIHARAVYAVWHAALGILAVDLAGRLARWEPTAPKANEAPWLQPRRRLLEVVSGDNSDAVKPLV